MDSKILLLLLVAAFAKANIIDDGLDYVKGLADDLAVLIDGVRGTADSSLTVAENYRAEYQRKTETAAKQHLDIARIKAVNGKCSNIAEINTRLDGIQGTISDRWPSCTNMSADVVNLAKFVTDIGSTLLDSETVICEGIQNVSRCDGNFIAKWACVTKGFQTYSVEFARQSQDVFSAVAKINDYLEAIVLDFRNCFMTVPQAVELEATQVLSTCVQ